VRSIRRVKLAVSVILALMVLAAPMFAVSLAQQAEGPATPSGAAGATADPPQGEAPAEPQPGETPTDPQPDDAAPPPSGEAAAQSQPADTGYVKVAENSRLALHVHPGTLGIRVENKRTGYVWYGALNERDEKLNQTWQGLFESGLTVEYMDRTRRARMAPVTAGKAKVAVQNTEDGFTADVRYEQLGIGLKLEVRLTEDAVELRVPFASIEETNPENQLQSLYLVPFFGATKGVQTDRGYMLIPDGSGALISLNEPTLATQPYVARVYGDDPGMSASEPAPEDYSLPPQIIHLPAFGITPREGANAFVSLIAGGAPYAEIRAYASGITTGYNWVTARWIYRETYFQPLDKKGNGMTLNQERKNEFDAALKIMFLDGEDADYSGMAKRLRQELVRRGDLPEPGLGGEAPIPLRLDILAAENKRRMLGKSVIPMTTLDEIDRILSDLAASGAQRMMVVVRGWTKGGATGASPTHFPFERKVGGADEWKAFLDKYERQGIPVYFYADYTVVDRSADGFGKTDLAKTISGQFIPLYYHTWLLKPSSSLEKFRDELDRFAKYGMSRLAVGTIGDRLYSSHAKPAATREQAMAAYREMLSEPAMQGYALYRPNLYLWKYADRLLDVPMGASGFLLATEEVPFLQMVLKGHVEFDSPPSNFHADPREALLKMIDYGSSPSFLVTWEDPVQLLNTGSEWIYTSQYAVWKDRILEEYRAAAQVQKAVGGATFDKREEVRDGVFRNRYSNGTVIYVNYTGEAVEADGHTIPAQGFLVREGGRP